MKIITNILFAALLLLLSTLIIYWIEADKELRVLCSLFEPGITTEYVGNTLDTANLLSYNLQENPLLIESRYNLWSSECKLTFAGNGTIIQKSYIQYFSLPYILSYLSLILTLVLAGFQLLLALGFPLGKWAWGGKHKVLPNHLRIGSAFSVIIFLLVGFLLLKFVSGDPILRDAFPVLAILFLISSFANLNSSSLPEKYVMTPIAFFLFLSFLSLALAG